MGFVEAKDKEGMQKINEIADDMWNRQIGLKYDYTSYAYMMFFNVQ
jgi:hypothetical protein